MRFNSRWPCEPAQARWLRVLSLSFPFCWLLNPKLICSLQELALWILIFNTYPLHFMEDLLHPGCIGGSLGDGGRYREWPDG